ncbi:MAG TPA: endonuclease/exonuclease/phosphatase family protein [Phycisphaerales bacterium]|nr:endonuclease/exonuclease/phosphatase family protein [Phycisphaerales bacterium]
MRSVRQAAVCALLACAAGSASAQLRIATWNISNYGGGREADFKTAVYTSFEGRSMSPDILMVQEVTSNTGASNLLTYLNNAPGSPGDWSRFTFVDGPDTDVAVLYRTSKIRPVNPPAQGDPDGYPNPITVVTGGNSNGAPRNVYRFDVQLQGYNAASTVVSLYPVHMKAGDASSDQSRRLAEATLIRANIATLPAGWHSVIAGDFNVQSSTQSAYQHMTGAPSLGRVNDPIRTPGSWNNNSAFRIVHTQDPAGAGGMDDRHDQILISDGLLDGQGFDYIGSLTQPYSTTTWNDPNHSYRSYGNDGTSYNATLTVAGNTMVGPTIAQALITICNGAGHLPILLDTRVPAKVTSDSVLNFGDAYVGDPSVSRTLNVSNDGNVAVWSAAGIANLSYSLGGAPAEYTVPAGTFNDAAGGGQNGHTITLSTIDPGDFGGTLTITSNDPDQPTRTVTLVGTVWCPADFDKSGFVDIEDYDAFVEAFEAGTDDADFDKSGFVDIVDFSEFVLRFEIGC